MRRNTVPAYYLHKQTGRGVTVWRDAFGVRHSRLHPGPFDSALSKAAHARLILELESSPVAHATNVASATVAIVLAHYLDFAERHYRGPDGKLTSTIHEVKLVVRVLNAVYGDTAAADFGPLKLKAAMHGWVKAKCSRTEGNRRLGIVKRIFKWAASEELIPAAVYHGLAVVSGLQRGRSTARETAPIAPVDDATIDATLPHLNRHVAGLVRFQRFTGCRPGEACDVRRCDIDTGGAVWLYRPTHHKTAHRGKARVIAIGPKAQEVLKEFFTLERDAYLFSPRRVMEEHRAQRAAKRETKRWPSHERRNATKRKAAPRRAPREKYDRNSYARAIARAIETANETAAEMASEAGMDYGPIPHWHPNQLRHTFATRVRKAHGLEAAQVLLGHSRADVTQIYAEKNEALAVAIAGEVG